MGHLDHLVESDVAPQGRVRPRVMPQSHDEAVNLSVWIRARQSSAMSAGTSRQCINRGNRSPRTSGLPVQRQTKP
ncbi:hypothetical protein N5W20_03870 [Candidatus Kirkpatrickella diaphorinae]|uniref:Uncharacterized protein n=1 Tax=Candidatus Kirkpatrickella diaphorinae TaxID=2984322 RepID=A0ABY6GKM3_9PROT|nr:hypothetical protein [Candidatus Kirkpatrickella diaphorinae]UYH52005.1 hypothetical protein N5W20_03870 [Candidatus Kirkpatrickella diaphorinae]